MRKKRGFTIIELIVVIAVLGILVLLAVPKLIGYAEKAKVTQIKNDSKAHEQHIGAELTKDSGFIEDWELIDPSELKEKVEERKLYNKRGLVQSEDKISEDLTYYEVPNKIINTHLPGLFVYGEDGTVYYDGPAGEKAEESDLEFSSEENFEWVEFEPPFIGMIRIGAETEGDFNEGYWKYIGNEEVVVIPHTINGHPVTSYYQMFSGLETETVKKVVSTNKKVTNMSSMFQEFSYVGEDEDYFLDLSELDTSGVTNMNDMFNYFEEEVVSLENWNTSNVESMRSMFYYSDIYMFVKADEYKKYIDMYKEVRNLEKEMFDLIFTIDSETWELWEQSEGDLSSFDEETLSTMAKIEEKREKYLEKLEAYENMDYNEYLHLNLNTSNVKEMPYMFYGMGVQPYMIESFDTSNVEDMSSMFQRANLENGQMLKHFDVRNVGSFSDLFKNSTINDDTLDLSTWVTPNAFRFSEMFYNVNLENLYIDNFTVEEASYYEDIFDGFSSSNVRTNSPGLQSLLGNSPR